MGKKVFLGGTCNGSKWRSTLIPLLNMSYFNPVVENWTEDDYYEEIFQRDICDYLLYTITPEMTGFYSIAELIEDSIKNPGKTIFCFTNKNSIEWTNDQKKSLHAIGKMVILNGGKVFTTLEDVAIYLNSKEGYRYELRTAQ